MKRFIAGALALGLAATTIPGNAEARGWRHGYHGHHGGAVAAGVVGLAFGTILGAAIANDGRGRYYDRCYDRCGGYYRDGYYDDGYYYNDDYGPSLCIVRERHWDPYRRREVIIEHRHPC